MYCNWLCEEYLEKCQTFIVLSWCGCIPSPIFACIYGLKVLHLVLHGFQEVVWVILQQSYTSKVKFISNPSLLPQNAYQCITRSIKPLWHSSSQFEEDSVIQFWMLLEWIFIYSRKEIVNHQWKVICN